MKYSNRKYYNEDKTLHSQDAKSWHQQFSQFSQVRKHQWNEKAYYGQDALLVRCGSYIYNVSSAPEIYYKVAH